MHLGGAQDLIVLMALTGDQHQISSLGLANGLGNRRSTIGHNNARTLGGNPSNHVIEDLLRVFGAWVIRSHHQLIGELSGNRPHLRPLAAVAITAATEHADELAFSKRARRLQGVVQPIRGVGVVHQHSG